MDRGYSIIYKEGQLIKSVEDVKKDDTILVTLQDGQLEAIVRRVEVKESGD